MKARNGLAALLAVVMVTALAACSTQQEPEDKETLYQVSLLQSLTLGDYHGAIPVQELKTKGDTGIGTFNALNGELIMVDGVVYRAAGDGTVEVVPDDETVPFANVSFLEADKTVELKDVANIDDLKAALDKQVAKLSGNEFYIIRIDGTFSKMNVRSEYKQKEPYEPLADVLETDQTFFDYENIEGTVVGLYCPPYMESLNATGWHLHFISKDRTKGGHVLDLSVKDATLSMDETPAFSMILPDNEMFDEQDLSVDQSADIKKVEQNKE